MICAPVGTLMLIFDWLDKTFTQISRADRQATRFEAAGGLVPEPDFQQLNLETKR